MTGSGGAKVSNVTPDDEPVDIARRLRAARILGGYDTPKALAEAIGERGFGEGPIKAIERGVRPMEPSEQAVVATACGLPPSFFTSPRAYLGDRVAAVDAMPDAGFELRRLADEVAALRTDLADGDGLPTRGHAATQVAEAAAQRRSAQRQPAAEGRPRRAGPRRG